MSDDGSTRGARRQRAQSTPRPSPRRSARPTCASPVDAGCRPSRSPLAAFVLALLVGAVLIIFSTRTCIESLPYFFSYPWDFFSTPARPSGTSTARWSADPSASWRRDRHARWSARRR